MNLLAPALPVTRRAARTGVLLLLAGSAAAVAAAPAWMAPGYSWMAHVISESAAQGVEGAWVARLGFICFGLAVLWLAVARRSSWPRGATWCHRGFGVFMVSTAAFSHRPWQAGVPFDAFEDLLHSVTATGMGFAFALGVLACALTRDSQVRRAGDVVAIAAATVLPLASLPWPALGGVMQRAMFLVAYAWYGAEAVGIPEARR